MWYEKLTLSPKRLADVTSKTSINYVPALSLVHCTQRTIDVLKAVQTKEEEYEYVKSLLGRIDGNPESVCLASRDRKLLQYGVLYLLGEESIREFSTSLPSKTKSERVRFDLVDSPSSGSSLCSTHSLSANSHDQKRFSLLPSPKSPKLRKKSSFLRRSPFAKSPSPPSGDHVLPVLVLVFNDLVLLAMLGAHFHPQQVTANDSLPYDLETIPLIPLGTKGVLRVLSVSLDPCNGKSKLDTRSHHCSSL
jgi:hypothetical protein